MDELDERVRSLDAERTRPDLKGLTVEELMQRLIATLDELFRAPTDGGQVTGFQARIAEYRRLRRLGCTVDQAAARLGVTRTTGYRYEALTKKDAAAP